MTEAQAIRRWRLLAGVAWLGVVLGGVQLALAWLWQDDLGDASRAMVTAHWAAFMSATFAFHAGLAMTPIALFAGLTRRWRLCILAIVVLGLGIGPEAAAGARRMIVGAPERNADHPTLKIMSVNLMYGRMDAGVLLAQISAEAPDVIVFQEWTPGAIRELAPKLGAEYPHASEAVRDDAFGQAVFSRREFVEPARTYAPAAGISVPQLSVVVDLNGRPLRIANVHILPPVRARVFAEQRRMAAGLTEWARMDDAPAAFAGDFNAVNGSSITRAMSAAGYRDAFDEAGQGWRGSTWPRVGFLKNVPGVRIDHVMIDERLECVAARVCEDFGSDHRPVIAEIRWKTQQPAK